MTRFPTITCVTLLLVALPAAAQQRTARATTVSRSAKEALYTWTDLKGVAKANYSEALESALDTAGERLRDELALSDVPPRELVRKMMRGKTEEKIPFTGDPSGTITELTRVALTVELTSESRRALQSWERESRVEARMIWLARLMFVAVVGLAATSVTLRIDDWSKGYFTGALRLAAGIAVGFAVLIALWWSRH